MLNNFLRYLFSKGEVSHLARMGSKSPTFYDSARWPGFGSSIALANRLPFSPRCDFLNYAPYPLRPAGPVGI